MKWSLAISRQFTRRRFYTVMCVCVCVLETTTRRSSSSSLLEMLASTDEAAPTLSPLSLSTFSNPLVFLPSLYVLNECLLYLPFLPPLYTTTTADYYFYYLYYFYHHQTEDAASYSVLQSKATLTLKWKRVLQSSSPRACREEVWLPVGKVDCAPKRQGCAHCCAASVPVVMVVRPHDTAHLLHTAKQIGAKQIVE